MIPFETPQDTLNTLLLEPDRGIQRVLDLGCGVGDTLGSLTGPNLCAFGLDLSIPRLCRASRNAPEVGFVCGRGESIPFRDNAFDLVFSEVALPYMNIPAAVSEIARVIRPGGAIWLKLHRARFVQREMGTSFRKLHFRDVLYRGYVLANGLCLHVAGVNVSVGWRCESFQTERGMQQILSRCGFSKIVAQQSPTTFVVSAIKNRT
jgi:ubiquinone/menaquinone biosynthesis C-methylase UbiE